MKKTSIVALFLFVVLVSALFGVSVGASGQDSKSVPPPPLPQTERKNTPPQNPPAQNDDEDVIKIGTELVNVPFSVTNKQNRYINDLTQEQLQILENGKEQEIFSFVKETDLPLTFALLIDVSGSQELSLPAQKTAALKFFEKVLRPEKDIAGLITFRRDVDLVQNLTSNKRALLAALNGIRFNPGSYVGATPPVNTDPSFNGTSIYDAVFVTADELLSREAGRRVVILLTDGHDTTSQYKRDKAVERALRAEVLVYVIGIPGMGQINGRTYQEPVNKGDMNKLCEATGGRAFYPEKEQDFYSAFQQIEEDLRQQYILSYSPSSGGRDGSFRTIMIKVQGRADAKDLRINSRKGYYAQ